MGKRIESGYVYTETFLEKYSADAEKWLQSKQGILHPVGDDYKRFNISPDESLEGPQPGNVLLTVGINQLWRRCATTDPVWDSTHGAIGVGDSTTAAASSQSAIQAVTNKYFQVWGGTPTVGASAGTTTTCIFSSTFATANANFAWNEYGVFIPTTSAATYTSSSTVQSLYEMLNRKAGAGLLGTKTSAQSWVFTVTMTLA